MTTLDRIAALIRAELDRTRAPKVCGEITAATRFDTHLLCSGIDLVCITLEVEDAFAVELPAEQLESCATVGALAEFVDQLTSPAAQAA